MAIPVAPIGRIIKDAGAERVSEDAKKELNAYVEAQAAKVAKKAIAIVKSNKDFLTICFEFNRLLFFINSPTFKFKL